MRIAALFPRGARLLLANGYLATVPLGFQMVIVPLYLSRAGLDPAFIGLLFTVSGLMTAGLVAVSGVLADRFGRSRFLIAGTALPIPSYMILALTTDPFWLVVAAALGAVGLANGAAGALTVSSLAFAGVPAMLGAPGIDPLVAYRPAFLVAIVILVVASLFVLPLRDLHPASGARAKHWLPRGSVRPIATYSLAIGLLGFGLGIAVQLMPLWLNLRFGSTEADLAPWYSFAQLISIASVVVVPWLDRRFGPSRSVLGMQLVSGAGLALIVIAPVFTVAISLFVMRSFLTNISWPFQQSLLMGAVVPRERASAAGIGFAVWGLANALGPALAGILLATGVHALPLLAGAV
ncbi:MAG: MFS transporter, partial [Chloroflexi bacterium]|nr:MFS transporter [Chloroflexota bacterium]